ncbi:MAG: hypothetical protein SGARI_005709, partial [Bacillariaceae sp.]
MTSIERTQGHVRILVSKIDPDKEAPSMLVHLPWHEEPLNTTSLNSLPSPGNLPELGSQYASFWDSDAEILYRHAYSGNVTIWTRIEKYEDRTTLCIVAYPHQSGTAEEMSAYFDVKSLLNQFPDRYLAVNFFIQPGSVRFHTVVPGTIPDMTDEQKIRLDYRMRHLFLMSQGAKLEASLLDRLSEQVAQCYSKEKMWKDAYQVLIGCASTLFFDLDEGLSSKHVQDNLYNA